MEVKDFVFETFLRLTSKTVPYGNEDTLMKEVGKLFPDGLQKDAHGNYFYKVGDSRTIFASHLDTVSSKYETVTHVFDGDYIRTDGKTTLGADDKAGTTVMLWMIRNNVPGLYYFFVGEEVRCIGSGLTAANRQFKDKYDRIISFDRRGTGSIITHQSCGRSCSDEFADDLCRELNKSGLEYTKDSGGVYTDSAEFVDEIPECTNVSVGYYKEHTTNEHQDITHLTALAEACVLVDWENLTTKRKPGSYEPKPYGGGYSWSWEYDYNPPSKSSSRSYGYHDDWYDDDKKVKGYDEEEEDWYWDGHRVVHTNSKKTRRSKKKRKRVNQFDKSKVYFDNGGDLLDITDYQKRERSFDETGGDKYGWILDKFLDHRLTIDDLELVKEQYLNMESDYDIFFYNYLLEKVV
jgi:hypothetical protein